MEKPNLILGAWAGPSAGIPNVFVESLNRTVPGARLVVFCHDISEEARDYFVQTGVTIEPFTHWPWWDGPVHTYRFSLFARYAAEHAWGYDRIMTADLRDVVVQSDPFEQMTSRDVHFFPEPGNQTLSTSPHYARWMRRFASPSDRLLCANDIPLCCGVILGGSDQMARYLEALAKRISRMGWLGRRKFGADSAFHNLMCYVTHDVPAVIVPDGELVATMAESGDAYNVDDTGVIRRSDGFAPPICHQYDRYPAIRAAVESRFN